MSFEPKTFIEISKELIKGSSEAHYRSMISRAYYGVFGHIKKELNMPTYGVSVHQDLLRSLQYSQNVNEKKIHKKLESLFKKRKEADYDYFRKITRDECHYVIANAEEMISLFDQSNE